MQQYLDILIESLQKKDNLLERLLALNLQQDKIIKENMQLDSFEETVEQKGKLIEELERLDVGFQSVYDKVKEQLLHNKLQWQKEIVLLQQLIRSITDKSVAMEASEKRNKASIEQYFSYTRNNFYKAQKSVKAASDYYKNMSQVNYIDPQLIDQKK